MSHSEPRPDEGFRRADNRWTAPQNRSEQRSPALHSGTLRDPISSPRDAEGGPLLDGGTKLVSPGQAGWVVNLAPDAGECSVTYVSPRSGGALVGSESNDEDNQQRAGRRARKEARQYAVQNQLVYRWTLTFPEETPCSRERFGTVRRRVNQLCRELRVGDEAFPYLYTIEEHPGGHGYHVNLLVGSRYEHSRVTELWGGHVWVSGPRRRFGRRATARGHVGYALKSLAYAMKGDERPERGLHRYERAQGFKVRRVRVVVRTFAEARAQALVRMAGEVPKHEFDLTSLADYRGPPCHFLVWN